MKRLLESKSRYLAASRRDVLRCSVGDGWDEVTRLVWEEGLWELLGLWESLELVGGVEDTTPSLTVSSRVN